MKKYGICEFSMIPVRSGESSKNEMVSQLLYGEVFQVLKQKKKWTKILICSDNYFGWINNTQIKFVTKKEYEKIIKRKPIFCVDFKGYVMDGNNEKTLIPFGGLVSSCEELNSVYYGKSSVSCEFDIIEIAKKYINSPYLWGGRNQHGIDCSGFSQIVYKINGINIPRDASQQAKLGEEISFSEINSGNLAFFGSSKNEISHVGLVLNKKKIIHAFGKVRIDDFNRDGIKNIKSKKITHKLIEIKKY